MHILTTPEVEKWVALTDMATTIQGLPWVTDFNVDQGWSYMFGITSTCRICFARLKAQLLAWMKVGFRIAIFDGGGTPKVARLFGESDRMPGLIKGTTAAAIEKKAPAAPHRWSERGLAAKERNRTQHVLGSDYMDPQTHDFPGY